MTKEQITLSPYTDFTQRPMDKTGGMADPEKSRSARVAGHVLGKVVLRIH